MQLRIFKAICMVSMSSSRNAKTVKHKASHIPRLPRQATDLYRTQSSPQPLNICIQSFSVPCWNNKDDCIQLRLADLCQDCHGILKTILSDTYTFFSLLLLLTYMHTPSWGLFTIHYCFGTIRGCVQKCLYSSSYIKRKFSSS